MPQSEKKTYNFKSKWNVQIMQNDSVIKWEENSEFFK